MTSIKVLSPYDNSLIKELTLNTPQEVEQKLSSAYELFQDKSKALPKYTRIAILEKTIEIMKSRKGELTKIAAQEGGKPFVDSQVEVDRAINGIQLAIESISYLTGQEISMGQTASSANRVAYTFKEPVGVVASVSAFNHPLNLIIHQTIPAIATGCPVIIKPATSTPLSCLNFVEILYEAGLPKEWCQAVLCDNATAEKLVTDKRISYFSFIGSARVGWYLSSKLSPGTRFALEHGGAAPVIVEPDADMEDMLPLLSKGGFYHAGQVCVSVQRIFIHESLCEDFANKLAGLAEKLVVGNPLDPKTEVGPLISTKEVDRLEEWVVQAEQQGAKVLTGGKRISDTCFQPTVLLNPSQESHVSQEEIFGPIVCVYSYTDRDEAIALANSLDFAFQASVFTKNIDVAFDTVKKLKATAVMVNDHTAFRVDWMPFGGHESSGIGVGGIPYTMHEMTLEKMMVIRSKAL